MAKNTRSRIIKAAEELYRTESQQKVGIRQIAQADVHIQLFISILKRKRIYYMQ